MLEITYWLTLNCVVMIPIYLIVRHVRNFAFLPVVLYGLSLWAFLVVGLPLESSNLGRGMNFNLSYYLVIISAAAPLYAFTVVGMDRKTFPRQPIELVVQRQASLAVFIILWCVILLGVAMYFVKVGRPPIFDVSIFDIIGSAQEMKDLRKDVTYTAEFRQYKFFFYTATPFAALVGYCLYLNRAISFLTNLLCVTVAMILTLSFLHKQGPIEIIATMFLLRLLVKKARLRLFFTAFFITTLFLLGVFAIYVGFNVSILDLLTRVAKRIIVPYIFSLEFGLSNFPSPFPFFYGATLPNPGDMFPFEQVDLSGFTMWYMSWNPRGALPMPALGELYVNFGNIGILIFFCAIFTWLLFVIFICRFLCRNPFGICLWVFLSFNIINCNKQGFMSAVSYKILLFGLAFVGLYYIVIQFMRSFGRVHCRDKLRKEWSLRSEPL